MEGSIDQFLARRPAGSCWGSRIGDRAMMPRPLGEVAPLRATLFAMFFPTASPEIHYERDSSCAHCENITGLKSPDIRIVNRITPIRPLLVSIPRSQPSCGRAVQFQEKKTLLRYRLHPHGASTPLSQKRPADP
jgi:hypothetical protein